MKEVLFYFALFFIYSFIGWLIEMFCVNVILKQKFANRGFLIGPYCPIYGSASLIMIFLLSRYKEDILVLFFMSIIICSITEYLTSYIMEKIFKARWWDYTNEPFNLNGRICLINSIAFGMLGVLLIKFINPFFSNLLLKINPLLFNIIINLTERPKLLHPAFRSAPPVLKAYIISRRSPDISRHNPRTTHTPSFSFIFWAVSSTYCLACGLGAAATVPCAAGPV